MRENGGPHGRIRMIRQCKRSALLLHNFTERRVMNVRDGGKKMVLHLEIQSANQPRKWFVVLRKIGGCPDFVFGPRSGQKLFFTFQCVKAGFFHHMRQLKNDGHHKPHGDVNNQKANKPRQPANKIDRYQNVEKAVKNFAEPEDDVFFSFDVVDGCIVNSPREIFTEVEHKHPCKGAHRVQKKHVNVLKAVHGSPGLCAAHPQQRTVGQIIVHTVDVGVGMVNHIVLDLPEKSVSAKCIHGQSHEFIHPLAAGKTFVAGIVHHVESRANKAKSKEKSEQQANPPTVSSEQQKKIQRRGNGEQNNGFAVQPPVAGFGEIILQKIGIHLFFQRLKKLWIAIVKANFHEW